jgi:hypothetical protein
MTEQKLKSNIQEVHAELERANTMTSQEKDLLGSLMEEIVIHAGADDEKKQAVTSELDRQATKFEMDYPKIAGLLRQIMDALGKMGI